MAKYNNRKFQNLNCIEKKEKRKKGRRSRCTFLWKIKGDIGKVCWDLALIDLPRASNIDRNFFTNGIRSRGLFFRIQAVSFYSRISSMATFIRTKAGPARVRKKFFSSFNGTRNNRVSITILNKRFDCETYRTSLVENFGYENGVEANDCWNTDSSSREEKGGKLYQTFLLSLV